MSHAGGGEICSLNEISTDSTRRQERTEVDLENPKVPKEYKTKVVEILKRNADVIAKNDFDLGQTDTVRMKIDTGDAMPVKLTPYRTPLALRPIVSDAIDKMLAEGVIERGNSPWSFPIVLVKKKTGEYRFAIDFRRLNSLTKKEYLTPLGIIDDILALLSGSRFFTTLDMLSGYWQVLMDEDDKLKTAFSCYERGSFNFRVMPFGVAGAPSLYSELMMRVLQGCESFATSYIDDILIFSKTFEEHIQHIQMVFDRLREHKLKMKLRKCAFAQSKTVYLGYEVSKAGIRPNEDQGYGSSY